MARPRRRVSVPRGVARDMSGDVILAVEISLRFSGINPLALSVNATQLEMDDLAVRRVKRCLGLTGIADE